MKSGIIVKIEGHQSLIQSENLLYQVAIKKTFSQSYQPFVGDHVYFEVHNESEKKGLIVDNEPRKNYLEKPKIANVDQIIVVTAVKEPEFNSFLLNKYLVMLEIAGFTPILVFTKIDLLDPDEQHHDQKIRQKMKAYKKLGYLVLEISNYQKEPTEWQKLTQILEQKLSVFVGQTGAGKSTILNHFLSPQKLIKTQTISHALKRGKHTTTATEIYNLTPETLIADTPGFASFSLQTIKPQELIDHSRLFTPYRQQCKFNDCTHLTEKNCFFLTNPQILSETKFIYEDYCKIVAELKQKRKIKWKI